ncbi:MAG: ribosomal L7Ae/L30e/S12e/Gadd45 family protein [Clostridia bacterium]|nr:ribosomal L7Ae/L30e/S12e/Gadd45 family protein [Clostridia bacterium]
MSNTLTNTERLRGILGLSQRAGRLVTGMDTTLSTVRTGKAVLVLLDESAAENTVKKLTDACIYYHVPLLKLPQDLLSYATGRDGRMMGALTDRGFAEKVKGLMAAD